MRRQAQPETTTESGSETSTDLNNSGAEASGEESGIETSGAETSGAEESGLESSGTDASGSETSTDVNNSGTEASGEESGNEASGLEGSGDVDNGTASGAEAEDEASGDVSGEEPIESERIVEDSKISSLQKKKKKKKIFRPGPCADSVNHPDVCVDSANPGQYHRPPDSVNQQSGWEREKRRSGWNGEFADEPADPGSGEARRDGQATQLAGLQCHYPGWIYPRHYPHQRGMGGGKSRTRENYWKIGISQITFA